ncbi:hypothetical protein QCE73_08870 [Caballeronia sp. LZ029]|uniref:hypothetical protein n=1 Tax=Caballeronia sp. LZ029 TaxID=3038564 RepID=UPI00285CB5EB|nr:hypothetical protein [Caballeronia sp. LZ029]MDR5743265.1 hypothetical protein [Caballeronia sp. LZ029]
MDNRTEMQIRHYVRVIELVRKREGRPIPSDFERDTPEWRECVEQMKAQLRHALSYDWNAPLAFERDMQINVDNVEDVEFVDAPRKGKA